MNNTLYAIRVSAFYMLAAFAQQIPAQPMGGLIGEVAGLPPGENRYVVEMRPVGGGSNGPAAESALVESSGRFQFARVAPGQYEFSVSAPDGAVVAREFVHVGGEMAAPPVQLRIRRAQSAASVHRGQSESAVSWARLNHKVPKAARKALDRASARRRAGKPEEAEAAYLEAIQADAEFVEALNDLGTLYYAAGRPANALKLLERARALDPVSAPVLANTAAALIALGRGAEAEPLARRSLALNPASARFRYLLGVSRAVQQKHDRETLDLLEQSIEAFPHAALPLAQIHLASGDSAAARSYLRRYLDSPKTDRKPQVEKWLNSLR